MVIKSSFENKIPLKSVLYISILVMNRFSKTESAIFILFGVFVASEGSYYSELSVISKPKPIVISKPMFVDLWYTWFTLRY